MSTAIASKLLSRVEAAEFLGLAPQTLSVWASSGRYGLPYVKVGRCAKYRLEDLERFLSRRTITHPGELSEQ